MRDGRFTLDDLRRAERAIDSYARGFITASRCVDAINAAMRNEWYGMGDAESTSERILAYLAHHGPTTAKGLAAGLCLSDKLVQMTLSRMRARRLVVRPSKRGGEWSLPSAAREGGT